MGDSVKILKKEQCCGCSACYAVCPKRCISMIADAEGFAYPSVDSSLCIKCGKCGLVCPLNENNSHLGAEAVRKSYAVKNKDKDIRAISTSGGAFGAMVKTALANDGIVVGAAYDNNMQVCHFIADNLKDASSFFGSKYVQSNLFQEDIYRRVENALKTKRLVLFSGSPCQVQGLRTFLESDYPNLITTDFICRAVSSPRIWKDYLHSIETDFKSRPSEVVFRNKTYGYHSSTMKVTFESGETYYGSGRVDPPHKAFFSNLISRPSCYNCAFRTSERSSDFTIFDCWSFTRLTGVTDDNLGYTHLWIHTKKGLEFMDEASQFLDMYPVELSSVLASDGVMSTRNIEDNPDRTKFMEKCLSVGLNAAVEEFIPVSAQDRFVEKSKKLLNNMGVLGILSKAERTSKMKKG